ncbi:NACHT domain-containing protein [Desmonostoc muscorum CCALA 125]|nr:NACHT domain-containing protein [Desmonostoc muscorum CCALA 125]
MQDIILQQKTYKQMKNHFNLTSRSKFKLLIFTIFFVLSFVSSVFSQTPKPTLTPDIKAKAALIQEIKDYAERHVKNDKSMDTGLVINLYGKNSVGLSAPEIAKIYEDEYTKQKDKKDNDLSEKVKNNIFLGLGWGAATILFILFILKETIQKYLTIVVDSLVNLTYRNISGLAIFSSWSLRRYQQGLINKHQTLNISFRPNKPLQLREVFVPLKVSGTSDRDSILADKAIIKYPRLLIRGIPGAGKSILLKYLTLSWADGKLNQALPKHVPVLLELHRLNNPNLNQEYFQKQLVDAFARDDFPNAERFVAQGLENGTLMLFLDGLDEVNSNVRPQVIKEIKDLLDKFDKCRVVITCRTAVYNQEFSEDVKQTLDIIDFSDRQIRRFLGAWKNQMPPEKSIDQLMQTLRERPQIMSLARNPLLLTIIAYLYTDTPFILPHSRAEFYQKSTDILLDSWDTAKNQRNQYKASDKRRVLQFLALFIQDNATQNTTDRRSLDYPTVLAEIKQVLPSLNLNSEQAQAILEEIEQRSGLLLKIDGGERYQFAHLTLQEFFAAAALLDKGDDLVQKFRIDRVTWREVVKLWCGLALNSTNVIQAVYQQDSVTAFECIADAQQVDQRLADEIIDNLKQQLEKVNDDEQLAIAFGAVAAAGSRQRGQVMFEFLESTLKTSSDSELKKAAVSALSRTNLPQAAEILFQYYQQQNFTEARQALIRMGDLAVFQLQSLAEKGDELAMQDLVQIGTPYAAEILKEIQNNPNSRLAQKAALYLAELTNKQTYSDD